MRAHQRMHGGGGEAAGGRHAHLLPPGRRRGDVRIETAATRGQEVHWQRLGRVPVPPQRRGARPHRVLQRRVQRAEVGAGREARLIATIGGRGGASMEPRRPLEVLSDQRRPHDHVAAPHGRARRRVREEGRCRAGHGQRIEQPGEQREGEEQHDGGTQFLPQGMVGHETPSAVSARSMSLIPRNGATMPPRPYTRRLRRSSVAAPSAR